jgi:large subunit ribosomal protein L34e
MVLPRNRSNSVRKIQKRVQTGESRTHYRRRVKGKRHHCAITGEELTGVHSVRGMKKSQRRPSRPFGGRLSPSAARKVIKLRARLEQGDIKMEQIPIEILPYIKSSSKK